MEDFIDKLSLLVMTGWSEMTYRRKLAAGFPRPTHRRGRRLYWLRADVERVIKGFTLPAPIAASKSQVPA